MAEIIRLNEYQSNRYPVSKDKSVNVTGTTLAEDFNNQPQRKVPQKFVVRNPLFTSEDTLFLIRRYLKEAVEEHEPDYLFMPMTNDLEPFWDLDVEKCWFNSVFAPYTAMFMAIREWPREFAAFVDGTMVNYQSDYDKLLDAFNHIHIKAMENRGQGYPKGTLSKDEFIRMTGLFYCLLQTADRTHGMKFDKVGHLCNGWNKESRIVNMNYKLATFYSERLQESTFSGINWLQFLYQSIPQYRDEKVSWIFNLTQFDVTEGATEYDFSFQNFVEILEMVRLLDPHQHQLMVILQNTNPVRRYMKRICNQGLWFNDTALGRKFSIVTNYKYQR